jgi:hypothetical protein
MFHTFQGDKLIALMMEAANTISVPEVAFNLN